VKCLQDDLRKPNQIKEEHLEELVLEETSVVLEYGSLYGFLSGSISAHLVTNLARLRLDPCRSSRSFGIMNERSIIIARVDIISSEVSLSAIV